MFEFTLKIEGFDKALALYGNDFEKELTESARIAINATARWALKKARDDMNGNVNFPSGYLNEDRLRVSRFASNETLEAAIFARFEPTSLARFAVDSGSKNGIMVNVKRGKAPVRIKKGFLWGLKKGSVRTGNTGLVIRSEGKPNGAYKPKEVGDRWPNLWLVYGPSVYQVFRNSMSKFQPEVQDKLELEFDRQLQLRIINKK